MVEDDEKLAMMQSKIDEMKSVKAIIVYSPDSKCVEVGKEIFQVLIFPGFS